MKQIPFFVICVLFLSSCMGKKNLYLSDLDFIYYSILDNHPGVYNEEDPEFRNNLKKFYENAKATLIPFRSDSDSKKIISQFVKNFDDTHLRVQWWNTSKDLEIDISRKFSIFQFSNDIPWISLPTFYLKIDQEKDFEQFIKNIPKFQTAEYIIFDLRGNQGGNSEYGSKIINALFEEEYAHQKRCLFHKNIYVDWRASKGNLNHISSLHYRYPNSWLQNVERGLKESIAKKNNYFREYSESCDLKNDLTPSSAINAKLIIIIDASNVSAALDFIDELRMMSQNVILIGQKTKADRLYMEVRSVSLPSGFGGFSFPIKVYRNRIRLDNQPYLPNIHYRNLNNTSSLQNFILTQIKELKI